jgi:hypothetical protein
MADLSAAVRWPVVVETVALGVVYVAGAWLAWLAAPLALLAYVAIVVLSNLAFMIAVCPYCLHCEERTCHSRYHLVARFFPARPGRGFGEQFRRNVVVMYPVWFLPPLAALWRLLVDPGWQVVVLLGLFCLGGFVVLPYASHRLCRTCANAARCPRGQVR